MSAKLSVREPVFITLCINRLLDITEVYCCFLQKSARCKSARTKNIAYYRLTAERYESWMQAIGRDPKENLSITHNAICSDHFTQDSHIYVDDKRVLKKVGSTLQEGGIDLDISRPSTIYHYLDQLSKSSTTSPANKGNTSTDSEGLTEALREDGSFYEHLTIMRKLNSVVSLRKLTKQVGDLREENKN
ncbi:hypothetical protein NQ318_014424 [Aromia moschata]|uniref:THAP-type domain-containing protein n=1 Tax=Aromia moschata TaxID=1265417 RepID=A0AAV8Y649_9CUCU|nr:hypothetical protein NQ318_014424 [Aromia moschata]